MPISKKELHRRHVFMLAEAMLKVAREDGDGYVAVHDPVVYRRLKRAGHHEVRLERNLTVPENPGKPVHYLRVEF